MRYAYHHAGRANFEHRISHDEVASPPISQLELAQAVAQYFRSSFCDSGAIYRGTGKVSGDWATISKMMQYDVLVEMKKKIDLFKVRASYDLEKHPA